MTPARIIQPKAFKEADPVWFGIIANVIWGTTFISSHELLKTWGPFTSSALRFSVAVMVLFVFLKFLKFTIQFPRTARQWFSIVLTGMLGFGLLFPLQIAALQWISSSLSASLMLTSPLMVMLLSGLLGHKVTGTKWVAILVGTIGGGILLMAHNEVLGQLKEDYWKGIIMTLGASLCLAASTLSGREALKEMNQYSLTFWSMFIGLIVLVPLSMLERPTQVQVGHSAILNLLYLALVCSVLAFFLWNFALKTSTAQNLASTMHIKTPVAIMLGTFIGGEKLTLPLVLGSALVGLGVWISQMDVSKIRVFSFYGARK